MKNNTLLALGAVALLMASQNAASAPNSNKSDAERLDLAADPSLKQLAPDYFQSLLPSAEKTPSEEKSIVFNKDVKFTPQQLADQAQTVKSTDDILKDLFTSPNYSAVSTKGSTAQSIKEKNPSPGQQKSVTIGNTTVYRDNSGNPVYVRG